MRNMDCENLRREIDESAPGESLSMFAGRHLSSCAECKTFSDQQQKLQNILANLGTIEAPGDFNFRLRARLAREKGSSARFPLNLSLAFKSAVAGALILMFGSVIFLSFRGSRDNSLTANNVTPAAVIDAKPPEPAEVAAPKTDQLVAVDATPASQPDVRPIRPRTSIRNLSARNSSRIGSREMGSTPATLIKAADLNARNDYAIDAVNQPVKVSLDNGRGASRTISLPPVSYGSQRVMAQGTAGLMASSRGAW